MDEDLANIIRQALDEAKAAGRAVPGGVDSNELSVIIRVGHEKILLGDPKEDWR